VGFNVVGNSDGIDLVGRSVGIDLPFALMMDVSSLALVCVF
jgi:hypothetical protein